APWPKLATAQGVNPGSFAAALPQQKRPQPCARAFAGNTTTQPLTYPDALPHQTLALGLVNQANEWSILNALNSKLVKILFIHELLPAPMFATNPCATPPTR